MTPLEVPHNEHYKIVELKGKKLQGFIAIHRLIEGVSTGGTRFYNYESAEEALDDALRLSKAMTYKCAIAGLPYGGAKGVIIADPQTADKEEILSEYAGYLNELKGQFYTGEDVGMTEEDVQKMLRISPYLIGQSDLAGDPSAYASLSVYYCMKTALRFKTGSDSLEKKVVAIKGIGKTGSELIRLVKEEGAKVIIADIDNEAIEKIQAIYPNIEIVDSDEIHKVEADVYAPCALGNDLTEETVGQIKAMIVCGTANNQLSSEDVGVKLFDKGIIYVPDYLANAGGVINVACELEPGGYDRDLVTKRIKKLESVCNNILFDSKARNLPTNIVANDLVEKILGLNQTHAKETLR